MSRNNETQVPGAAPGGPDTPRRPATHRNYPLCHTSKYMPPGSSIIGLSTKNQPSKKVWELHYGLSEKQHAALSARFPGIAFVQIGTDCHDHPIAHTSYRIVWQNILGKLSPGEKVADISGNPQHNEIFNLGQAKRRDPITIDTFCKVMCPKDSVRAKTRWGPAMVGDRTRWEELTLYDMYRNDANRERFSKYDKFLMNHVLYYYKMSEINKLLQLNKSSVLIATVHKLQGQNGTINCGEQHYEKDFVTGKVTQENVETGETYVHDDPAPWFKNFCYADQHGAIAWTINKGCDDTYVITITSTEPGLVPADYWLDGTVVSVYNNEKHRIKVVDVADPPPAYAVEEVVIRAADIVPGYTAGTEKVIRITHPELFGALKTFMLNKPRNARTLADLTNKAHREVGNNTLVGGSKRVKISAEALTEHVFAAWTSGLELEAKLFSAVVGASSEAATVNRNLSGKSTVLGRGNLMKQSVRTALGISAIARSKEPVEAVLRHLDELL